MPPDFTDPAAEAKAAKAAEADRKKQEAAAETIKATQQAERERKRQEAEAEDRADAERRRLEAEAAKTPVQSAPADGSVTLSKEAHEGIMARLAAAEARLSSIAAPPPPKESNGPDGSHDLHKYDEGELVSRADGKTTYKYKHVPDDPHGKPHKLKNKTHFFEAASVAELRAHFDGNLLATIEKRERAKADKAAKKAAMIEDDDEEDDDE